MPSGMEDPLGLALELAAAAVLLVTLRALGAAFEAGLTALGVPRAEELAADPEAGLRARALGRLVARPESTAAGMRQIDPVLIRVGRSFRAGWGQMALKVYLPAMRPSVMNGVRLGLGIAVIGTLLAETKLSNQGLGYLIMQAYSIFDMPKMYALLITLFAFAIAANTVVGRIGGATARK